MVYIWLTVFSLLVFNLVTIIYQLMCLTDLELDHINPYDSASWINQVIFPEYALQGAVCLIFLLSGHWVMLLFCIPNLHYNFSQYQRRQHLIDVTEIFNHLSREKKKRLFKVINVSILIVLSLLRMFCSALDDHQ